MTEGGQKKGIKQDAQMRTLTAIDNLDRGNEKQPLASFVAYSIT